MTLARKTPLRARKSMPRPEKPMPKVSAKRRAYRKSAEGQANMRHMARVRSLPCVICHEFGHVQATQSEAHHVIHGRYSTRRSPDTQTIPLCAEHHRESGDPSKVALHQQPARWKRLYGEDTRWLSWVEQRLGLDK